MNATRNPALETRSAGATPGGRKLARLLRGRRAKGKTMQPQCSSPPPKRTRIIPCGRPALPVLTIVKGGKGGQSKSTEYRMLEENLPKREPWKPRSLRR